MRTHDKGGPVVWKGRVGGALFRESSDNLKTVKMASAQAEHFFWSFSAIPLCAWATQCPHHANLMQASLRALASSFAEVVIQVESGRDRQTKRGGMREHVRTSNVTSRPRTKSWRGSSTEP